MEVCFVADVRKNRNSSGKSTKLLVHAALCVCVFFGNLLFRHGLFSVIRLESRGEVVGLNRVHRPVGGGATRHLRMQEAGTQKKRKMAT